MKGGSNPLIRPVRSGGTLGRRNGRCPVLDGLCIDRGRPVVPQTVSSWLLFDSHFEALPEALQRYALDQQLPYLATKAARYRGGPRRIPQHGRLRAPATTDAGELAAIQRGCEHLTRVQGLQAEAPLIDVGSVGPMR